MQNNNISILTIVEVLALVYVAHYVGEVKGYVKGVTVTAKAYESKNLKESE